MNDRLARAALSRLTEPGDLRTAALVAQHGAERVVELVRGERDLTGLRTDMAARLGDADPERDLDEAAARGIRFVIPGDPEWPASLADLDRCDPVHRLGGAPLGLWVRGTLPVAATCARAVAVVGSRSATSYGTDRAGELGAELAGAGVTVVSGAAFGIDQAAHRGCLAARGPTVAVLAGGVDRPYPAAHRTLLDYIADTGLVLSEAPPGWTPTRVRFLARNRLIAALARGTVVVEAAVRSGALSTATWTGRLSRVLMGVPGPVTSASSQGVHELLRTGEGILVTRASDVLELVSPAGTHLAPVLRGPTTARDRLDLRDQQVLEAVPVVVPATAASISRTAGIGLAEVESALRRLQAAGFVECDPSGWRLAPR